MTDSQYNSVNDDRQQLLLDWLAQLSVSYDGMSALSTDAGTRRYFRLHNADNPVLAVDANPEFEDTAAFVNIAKRIARTGVRVPIIHHYNLETGLLIIEDLGDTHAQQNITHTPESITPLYHRAINDLIILQQHAQTSGLPLFDRQFIRFELTIFEQWYLQTHLRLPDSQTPKQTLDEVFELLIKNCEAQPQAFMHRDFHCRNLMVTEDTAIAVIDFQGAMLGPITYDPGCLLKDAYCKTPGNLERELLGIHRQSLDTIPSDADYRRWYELTALQRHLKILGIFCRLNYRDNKPGYMNHLETVAGHVLNTARAYEELADFCKFFESIAWQSTPK